jgi:hypothetical protein
MGPLAGRAVRTSAREAFVLETCRPLTSTCCRYLLMAPSGWTCGKLTALRAEIDHRVATGLFRATGDNCDGEMW